MNNIFDQLREQVNELKHDNPMVTSSYILREDTLSAINETENRYNKYIKEIKSSIIDEFATRLKKSSEDIISNPDVMLDCKRCEILRYDEIDKIVEKFKLEL